MITVTDKAFEELKRLLEDLHLYPYPYVRIAVVGGGCSGFSYDFSVDKNSPNINDEIIQKDDIKVLVDKKSMLYLNGTELDFSGGLNGKGLVFNNPNAKRTCGCGSSFST